MNKSLAILIYLVISISSDLWAQTEQINHSTEASDTSISKFKQKYNYFTRAQIEEKSLFKLNLIDYIAVASGLIGTGIIWAPSLIYEHKILPYWSGIVEVNYFLLNPYCKCNVSYFGIGTRYYYNINRRIRLGKQANNFSANYLFLKYTNGVIYRRDEKTYQNIPGAFILGYGIQRRLGKYGFLDFNFGLEKDKWSGPYPYFKFGIGFGL